MTETPETPIDLIESPAFLPDVPGPVPLLEQLHARQREYGFLDEPFLDAVDVARRMEPGAIVETVSESELHGYGGAGLVGLVYWFVYLRRRPDTSP